MHIDAAVIIRLLDSLRAKLLKRSSYLKTRDHL